MFWRFQDPLSPGYDERAAAAYGNVIQRCYQKMDEILGWVMSNIGDDAVLIVLSDHGFGSFHRSVHLNSWLRENGYLVLKDNSSGYGKEFFEDVDWSRTRAYALGFGGIYVNQQGREGQGIVGRGEEKEKLKKKISDELYGWYDSGKQRLIVKQVYDSAEIFSGPYEKDAPDLFVGLNEGYRASWQTALGACPEDTVEDNLKPWSGDHLFDPAVVPGIFFVNRKAELRNPGIIDAVPTILKLLDINEKVKFDGKPLL